MNKKIIAFLIVFAVLFAASPACLARNASDRYGYRGYDRGNDNYRYDYSSDRDYGRSGRRDSGYAYQGKKNAAAYPDYASNANYYYGTGSYNYGYNYGYSSGCVYNCPVNYGYSYSYYNPAPGATNYTRPVISNSGCANRYNYTNCDYNYYNNYRYRYSY